MSLATCSSLEEQARTATIAAIRISLAQLGAGTAPEDVVRQLRQFDLDVTVADVEAVKAQLYLHGQPAESLDAVSQGSAAALPADEAWRESEATASPTLTDAQRLLAATGSVDLAKHSLDVAEQEGRAAAESLPPDDVPSASRKT